MAAGSAGSAGSAGNAYVVDTDSPFQTEYGFSDTMKTIRRAFVGPEKAKLLEQIQGLQTQKQKLLQAVDYLTETVGELRRKDGNMQYTQDYAALHALYDKAKDDANTYSNRAAIENQAYMKLLEAYKLIKKAYKPLLSNSSVSTDLKYQLQGQIAIAESVAKEAKDMGRTQTPTPRAGV